MEIPSVVFLCLSTGVFFSSFRVHLCVCIIATHITTICVNVTMRIMNTVQTNEFQLQIKCCHLACGYNKIDSPTESSEFLQRNFHLTTCICFDVSQMPKCTLPKIKSTKARKGSDCVTDLHMYHSQKLTFANQGVFKHWLFKATQNGLAHIWKPSSNPFECVRF